MTEAAVLYLAATAIVAGLGAYFGAYLKKKGESLATREDLEKLVRQTEAVTSATKRIEEQISDEFWQRRCRWEAKRDTIFEAMKRLGEFEAAIAQLAGSMAAGDRGIAGPQAIEDQIQLRREVSSAMKMFGISKNLVMLACGEDANPVLASVQIEMADLVKRVMTGQPIDRDTAFLGMANPLAQVYTFLRAHLGTESGPRPAS